MAEAGPAGGMRVGGATAGPAPAGAGAIDGADGVDGAGRVAPAELALLASVFVVAACGLLYELAAGTLASWLLGDSVLRFSTIIGAYLFALGVGAWLSRYVEGELVATFLRVELLVGLLGGTMPAALFVAHDVLQPQGGAAGFQTLLYVMVGGVGVLVGLEVPLVMRILKAQFRDRWRLSELVSQVLTFDYLGALAVALAFPLVLLPRLGLVRTGVVFGLMNVMVAGWALWLFRRQLAARRRYAAATLAVGALLAATGFGADALTRWSEDRFYGEPIVRAATSPVQRVVVTADRSGHTRLYLNGNLQFDSRDEYRYHEALVHPVLAAHAAPRRVAILGGGDGMALREVLRYPGVEQVTLVELDAEVSHLFSTDPRLVRLNGGAYASPKLRVVHADAFEWLASSAEPPFDVVIVDFPDPSNYTLGKLYTTTFYALLERHLAASGWAVVQSTSPLVARASFWTVVATLEAVGLTTTPYHVNVPSFGEWGFIIAGRRPWRPPTDLPAGLRFLTVDGIAPMRYFPPDMARVEVEPNRLSNQVLVHRFEAEWGRVPSR